MGYSGTNAWDMPPIMAASKQPTKMIGEQKITLDPPPDDRTPYEKAAGVNPPTFLSTTDPTGNLKDQFKLDPYSGEALQALKSQAFAQGDSPWAQMQKTQQQLEQQGASDTATKRAMQASSGALSNLARTGGATGGAAALMARQGARDALGAQQDISRQGVMQRLGINQQDLDRKNSLLGKFGDMENQANQTNINQASNSMTLQNAFNTNRYNQQMAAWGAKETANGMRSSGGGGKK